MKYEKIIAKFAFLDYKNKISGVEKLIHLTDNFESDMQKIEDFYKDIPAKFPEKYNKKIF